MRGQFRRTEPTVGIGMRRNDHRPPCRVGVNNLQLQALTQAQPHLQQGAGRIPVDPRLVIREPSSTPVLPVSHPG